MPNRVMKVPETAFVQISQCTIDGAFRYEFRRVHILHGSEDFRRHQFGAHPQRGSTEVTCTPVPNNSRRNKSEKASNACLDEP